MRRNPAMTFLPIVNRELRVAARRWSTYWLRSGAALAVIAAGTWLFVILHDEAPRVIATTLFCVMTGSAVLYALLSGVRTTADCLSEEKREGTLGLLFLTDLRGYDVVVGKLVASSLNAFYAVVAAMPMLAIPLLMGGVTVGEFGRMALVALNTLFGSLALGLGVSALSHSGQTARGLTLLVLLVLAAGFPALGGTLALWGKTRQFTWLLLLPSPGFSYYLALDFAYKLNSEKFWYSVGFFNALGWLALALACAVAPRSWQDRPADAKTLRWRERWQFWNYGDLAERTGFRRRLLARNAFFWLASRVRLRPALVWAVLLLTACLWMWGLAKFRRDWLDPGVYVSTGLLLNFVLRCWFAIESTRQLAEERRTGTLELLLSTPLRVSEILHGQFLALRRQFLGPVVVVLLAEFAFLYGSVTAVADADERLAWSCFWGAGMVMMLADLAALYWVGMWQGLTARNPSRASSAGLARILVAPWAAYGLVLVLMVVLSFGRNPQPDPGWKFFLGLWFVLGLVADLGFALSARHNLLTRFRQTAQERYQARAGFWKRLAAGLRPAPSPPPVQPPR